MSVTSGLKPVEARTQELGRELFAKTQQYQPSVAERFQDDLMVRLMEDERLKTRLLRFVDVLASLDFDKGGTEVKRLAREYLSEPFPGLPLSLETALRTGLSDVDPPPLLASVARWLTKMFASRFIIHEGEKEALQAIAYLHRYHRYATFNILGERILSDEEAAQHKRRYLELIRELGSHAAPDARAPSGIQALQVSIKPSSLVADFNPADPEGTISRERGAFEEILDAARRGSISVNLDAEHYEYRDLTWHLFTRIFGPDGHFSHWDGAAMVLQGYLSDSERHASDVIAFARERGAPFQVRLVKGAYWDYEVIQAQQMGWPVPVLLDKADTDACFERLVWLFLESYPRIRLAVGSHNIRSHAYAEAVREHLGLPPYVVEHQTLFRTAEGISRALADMGWEVRDYVPAGDLMPGMAYLVRRILENSSLTGFLMQSRLKHDAEKLLRPPVTQKPAREALAAEVPPNEDTFRNYSPKRLFVAAEREPFQRALRDVPERWGETYPLRLGNEEVYTEDVVPSLCPSHPDPQRPVGWVHQAGHHEAERAIELANEAFPTWSALPVAERASILRKASALMKAERDELAAWVVHEGAKNWEGALADVDEAIDYLAYYAERALHIAKEAPDRYIPRGVVAVIPPWNFPIAIPCGMTSAALVTGNTVILKPAGPTPIITHKMTELLQRAGVPAQALIHLPGGGGTVGQALVESPNVDMVAFTGSKAVGTHIYETVCRVQPRRGGIKRAITEMGGKNAIVVFPDADMDEAIQGILQSAFGHANQKCSACSRVFVHVAVYDRLKERLIHATHSLKAGPADEPSTFINPVITAEAQERILACARTARTEGHVLIDIMSEAGGEGYLLKPLLVELQPAQAATAETAQEEIFGPVLALIPFATEDEAVAMVNGTAYALTAGVFSRSPRTVARMIARIRAGNIYVNRTITGARVGLEPFGGFQMSGTGPKAGGEEYLYAFLRRRDGYQRGTRNGEQGTIGPRAQDVAPAAAECPQVRPWAEVSAKERIGMLAAALEQLKREPAAAEAVALAARLLGQAEEIMEPQPTISVPGQKTYINWTTPRGRGLIAADKDTSLATLCGMIFGALLAGNGIVVVPDDARRKGAESIITQLHQSGVPGEVVSLGPAGGPGMAAKLAEGPWEFVATDLNLEDTRAIYQALGERPPGHNCLKALIATAEGPIPGETGYLRQFAIPKTVAIRTLRHGAELELV